jgi:hypothetical protein
MIAAMLVDDWVEWTKNGTTEEGTFYINARNPNKVMGSHIEMLCKQYDIKYSGSGDAL